MFDVISVQMCIFMCDTVITVSGHASIIKDSHTIAIMQLMNFLYWLVFNPPLLCCQNNLPLRNVSPKAMYRILNRANCLFIFK